MSGSRFRGERSGGWTKPTPFESILGNHVHGHIYILSPDNRLLPYEYRDGGAPKHAAGVAQIFFRELSEYLISNKLAGVLGLEVLEDTSSPQPHMLEFILAGQGTVMVKEQEAARADLYRVTGWSFAKDKDGIISIKGNETHAGTAGGGHQIFTDGKPLKDIEAVMKLLLQERVLRAISNSRK